MWCVSVTCGVCCSAYLVVVRVALVSIILFSLVYIQSLYILAECLSLLPWYLLRCTLSLFSVTPKTLVDANSDCHWVFCTLRKWMILYIYKENVASVIIASVKPISEWVLAEQGCSLASSLHYPAPYHRNTVFPSFIILTFTSLSPLTAHFVALLYFVFLVFFNRISAVHSYMY